MEYVFAAVSVTGAELSACAEEMRMLPATAIVLLATELNQSANFIERFDSPVGIVMLKR